MKMQLSEVAVAVHAENELKDAWQTIEIENVAFDTRKMKSNSLFVPLEGARDGHDFIQTAIDDGAVATFWQNGHDNIPQDFPVIIVDDPLTAMQDLARHFLMKINPKVVAITGSNGKTTTKDMTAAILATQYNVQKTPENFNNDIGVPMTILKMNTNTEVLVVEMGMDRFGQLDFLSKLVTPDVAVITMIGEAHIEFFGTRAKIADAKMEITNGLKEDGTFIFDGDEPLLVERAADIPQTKRTFGQGKHEDETLVSKTITTHPDETTFTTNIWPNESFTIPILGAYNVNNALAALLVGQHYHVKLENMQTALKQFQVTENRTEWYRGANGEEILSDVYNANPTADKAVLKTFSELATKGKRYVVLGDMLELGDQSQQLHEGLATSLDPSKIEEVYLYGSEMKNLAARLSTVYPENQLHHYDFEHQDQMIADLKSRLTASDMILLKGSHGMHLENVLDALRCVKRN